MERRWRKKWQCRRRRRRTKILQILSTLGGIFFCPHLTPLVLPMPRSEFGYCACGKFVYFKTHRRSCYNPGGLVRRLRASAAQFSAVPDHGARTGLFNNDDGVPAPETDAESAPEGGAPGRALGSVEGDAAPSSTSFLDDAMFPPTSAKRQVTASGAPPSNSFFPPLHSRRLIRHLLTMLTPFAQ